MNKKLSVFVILLLVVIGTLGAHVETQKLPSNSSASSGGVAARKLPSPPSSPKKPAVGGSIPKVLGSSGSNRARAANNPESGKKTEQPSLKSAQNNKPAPGVTENLKPSVKAVASRSGLLPPNKKPTDDAAKKSPEPGKKSTEAPKKSTESVKKPRGN